MNKKIELDKYDERLGLQLNWEDDFRIEVKNIDDEFFLIANSEGLISLARHMLTLAQLDVPVGTHIHLDEYNSLEEGSANFIIEKGA